MKREVLKIYLIITFFLFLSIFAYYLYKESNDELKKDFVFFNNESGFYDKTITIKLSKNVDLPIGTDLYYTLNGNDPTRESVKYNDPIKLEMVPGETKVYPLKVIAYYKDKYSIILEKTYVLDKDIKKNDIRIVSITSDEKNLYDYETGILVKGKTYDDNVKKQVSGYIKGNYNNRGEEWEKEGNVTIFDKMGNIDYSRISGIAISGSTSASLESKSFKIIANKYDNKNKLEFNFISDSISLNTSFVNTYNSLRLRAGSKDQFSGNIRSSLASRLANQSGFDGCTTTERAIVFLNGNYYGVYDFQQNYSNSFISNKYGLADSEKIIKIKGTEKKFQNILSKYFENNDVKELEKSIDMDNYLFYYAFEILMNNVDWPGNNYEVWKYTGDYDENNKYTDGKYRFLLFDFDETYYARSSSDIFVSIMESRLRGEGSHFKDIINLNSYRDKYVMITQDLLNTAFNKENILKIVEEEANKIKKSYRKYYSSEDYNNFVRSIDKLKSGVKRRDITISNDFKKYFNLLEKHKVTVKTNKGIQINFSNQELFQNNTYSNNYYVDIDLRYNYKEYPGYKFNYWLVNGKKIYNQELVIESELYKDIDEISIEAIAKYTEDDNHLLISEVYANGDSDWIKIFNGSNNTIDLKGYYLSDRENKLLKYELPNIELKSGASIIINGDKNYYSIGDYICNFSIKKGEKVFLSKNNEIIESVAIPKMSDIESYGRYDNSNTYRFFNNVNNARKKD